jgi:hypothetical protein
MIVTVTARVRREERHQLEFLHRRWRVLEPLRDQKGRQAREHQQREHDPRALIAAR